MATEGYFTHAWGTRAKGMGGAGLAFSLDSLSGALNPALILGQGGRIDFGVSLFMPSRSFSAGAASGGMFPLAEGAVASDRWGFVVPSLGTVWNSPDGRLSYGLLVYGNGGMNTQYPASVFGAGEAGVNLEQMFISPTCAVKVDDRTSVGLGLIYCIQKFSADGLGSFAGMSSDPQHLTDNGTATSTGVGVKLGVSHKVNEALSLGAAWEPKINMSRFDKYKGLFAGQGDFDVPESWGIGIAYKPSKDQVWALDVRRIRYSGVAAVGNSFTMSAPLGADDGSGFGWRDMTVIKLGHEWKGREDLTYRLGATYGRQPIPGSEVLFNILAPGVQEWQFTAGFTKKAGRGELSFAAMYSPDKKISGQNPMAQGQQIDLRMHQWDFEVGYSIKF